MYAQQRWWGRKTDEIGRGDPLMMKDGAYFKGCVTRVRREEICISDAEMSAA